MIVNLLQWWNLVFLLPFAGAAVFMLVQGVSGIHGGDAEHEIESDHDHDADANHDHEAEPSTVTKALLFLGVGRVPVSTLVSTMGVLWGVSGWLANQALEPVLRSPLLFFPAACAVALVATSFGTRWAALAQAFGEALANSKMTIWGDPNTFLRMAQSFSLGQSNGMFLQGLSESTPDGVKEAVSDGLNGIAKAGAGLLSKLTGQPVTEAQIEQLLRSQVKNNDQPVT